MTTWTKQMTKAFMDGWNGDEEDDKPFKEIIAETKEDMDFLTGFYADEPEERKPKIIPAWEEKTTTTAYKPTDYKSTNSTTLLNNNSTYNREAKQNPNTGLGYSQSSVSTNVANNSNVQNVLSKVNNTTASKSIGTTQPKTKSIWDDLTAGAGYALSGGSSLRNEPQKANNYTPKYTNSESKITSFLNTKQTAQTKPQSQGVIQSLGTGASYHNSGGMSANWDRNGSLDLSGTRKAVERIGNTLEKYTPQISNGIYAGNYWGATSTQSPFDSLDHISNKAREAVNKYGNVFSNAGLGAVTGNNNGITNPQSIADGVKSVWNILNDNDSILSRRIQDAASGANASVYHGITDHDEIEYLLLRYLSGFLKPIDETINMGLDNMEITKQLNVGATLANNGDYNTWLKYNNLIDNEASAGYKKEFIFSDGINKRAEANKASAYLGGMGDVASGFGEFTLGGITGKHKLADDVLSLGSAYAMAMDEAAAQGLPYEQAKAMALSQVGKNLLKNEILSKTADFSDDVLGFAKVNKRYYNETTDIYSRPTHYRKNVREIVWNNSKNENGEVIDPLTGVVMNFDDPWDMGHKPGYEFRKHKKSAQERNIERKQFLNEYNNPNHYRPELPSSNRGHLGEDNTETYYGP